jgi:heme-degrading monooxygenase HmoA
MPTPTHAVLVRLRSELDHDEIVEIMNARAPEFRALEGLEQKYYLHDPETGEYGGFYVWRSADDVRQYRESELAASIAAAYRGVGAPQVTVFEIVMPLRD